jgi:glycosyltransferase involved in cell wall biosynthesis
MTRISLCMIVKNESAHLARCLTSAQLYVDEIVVVDTGSQDDTMAIAQQFGAKLDNFAWCDDFSAARNYALTKVSGEWILHLDADEELVVEHPDFRQQLSERSQVLAYAIQRTDLTPFQSPVMLGGFHIRLFRNLPEFRYTNRYHEQLRYHGDRAPVFEPLNGLEILHHGNSDAAAVRRKTLNRDIPILESIRASEGLNFWLLDCLARNYLHTEQVEQAESCYNEAADRLFPHLLSGEKPEDAYWLPTLMHFLASEARDRQDFESARLLCQRGLEWFPTHIPLTYLSGEMLLDFGFPWGAIAYFQRCLDLGQSGQFYALEPFPQSLMTIDPACAIGAAFQALSAPDAAIAAYEQALSFDPNCAPALAALSDLVRA